MQYNVRNITILLSVLAFTACTDDAFDPMTQDVSKKTPIELYVGVEDVDGLTRSITVDKNTLSSLPTGTSLFMVMKSEHINDNQKSPKFTMTKGETGAADANKISSISFNEGYKRYWDDAYAREAALSVFAVCFPGGNNNAPTINNTNDYSFTITDSNPSPLAWKDSNTIEIVDFSVNNSQSFAEVEDFNNQDLCYSNNVSKYQVETTTTDNRIKFDNNKNQFERTKKLNFYHALSKITFIIKSGTGFTDFEHGFSFPNGENLSIKNMNVKGTFSLVEGEFSNISTGEINNMYQREKKTENNVCSYTLDAMVLPGTDMSSTGKEISFTVNDNHYELSKNDLLEKITTDGKNLLKDNKYLMPGVHYVFTLTISKTQIQHIEARLVEWETVEASMTPSNARLTFSFEQRGTNVTNTSGEKFEIYRAANENTSGKSESNFFSYDWKANYSSQGEGNGPSNGLAYTGSQWNTEWFWPNNNTFYHLRTVGVKGSDVIPSVQKAENDYFSINDSESFKDILWGAPFKELNNNGTTAKKITYSTSCGFDGKGAETTEESVKEHQIYYAIGPTNSPIHIVMFHMMSKVQFKVKTVSGNGGVNLGDGTDGNATTITLKNIHRSGKVLMGNGLVLSTDSRADYSFTDKKSPSSGVITWSDYGAIPQSLKESGQAVVLVITTPDKNIYEIKLKDLWTENVSTHNIEIPYSSKTENEKTLYNVYYWYPNYSYTYTFTLSKKGIDDIKVTILDWETVTAEDDEVQIQ